METNAQKHFFFICISLLYVYPFLFCTLGTANTGTQINAEEKNLCTPVVLIPLQIMLKLFNVSFNYNTVH